MSKYEVGFILSPNIDDSVTQDTINKLKEIYTSSNGIILDEYDMGMRELAYRIDKDTSGYYYFLNVEADHDMNQEFERISRIDENVIRFLVLNIDEVEGSTLDVLREDKNSKE